MTNLSSTAILKNYQNTDNINHIIRHSMAENTWRAYEKGWRCFQVYCHQINQSALPASLDTVVSFFVYLSSNPSPSSNRKLSIGTIVMYRSAIQKVHELSNYESPTDSAKVGQIISGLKRMYGVAPKRVKALRDFHIKKMIAQCNNTPIGIRDAAIIVIGFAAALRRSEICNLRYEDIEIIPADKNNAKRMVITVRVSKTDQEGEGQKIAVPTGKNLRPIDKLLDWLSISKITEGYLFQSMFKGGRPRGNKMHHSDIPRIVKKYASLIGLDTGNIAGHSLRAGFVTSAVANYARLDKIMEITRHKTPQMVLYYMRDNESFKDHAGSGFL